MKIADHSVRIRAAVGDDFEVYLSDTGDPELKELRLSFLQCSLHCSIDCTPTEMAKIGHLILGALKDEGFCKHGVQLDEFGDGCTDCFLESV